MYIHIIHTSSVCDESEQIILTTWFALLFIIKLKLKMFIFIKINSSNIECKNNFIAWYPVQLIFRY